MLSVGRRQAPPVTHLERIITGGFRPDGVVCRTLCRRRRPLFLNPAELPAGAVRDQRLERAPDQCLSYDPRPAAGTDPGAPGYPKLLWRLGGI